MLCFIFNRFAPTSSGNVNIVFSNNYNAVFVGPCHPSMARPQVADGGTASDMEGSCE